MSLPTNVLQRFLVQWAFNFLPQNYHDNKLLTTLLPNSASSHAMGILSSDNMYLAISVSIVLMPRGQVQ